MVGATRPGDMYIERPDEYQVEEGEPGTMCWRNPDVFCTGACQAFDPHYADDDTGRFTCCRLINVQIAAGSAFAKLVQFLTSTKGTIPGQDIKPPGA